MPPRHAYWTIIFGNQPTAFRSATADELLPTLRQIQSKHPDAVMMWFARGRLLDAQFLWVVLRRDGETGDMDTLVGKNGRHDEPFRDGVDGTRRRSPGVSAIDTVRSAICTSLRLHWSHRRGACIAGAYAS